MVADWQRADQVFLFVEGARVANGRRVDLVDRFAVGSDQLFGQVQSQRRGELEDLVMAEDGGDDPAGAGLVLFDGGGRVSVHGLPGDLHHVRLGPCGLLGLQPADDRSDDLRLGLVPTPFLGPSGGRPRCPHVGQIGVKTGAGSRFAIERTALRCSPVRLWPGGCPGWPTGPSSTTISGDGYPAVVGQVLGFELPPLGG